MNLRKVRENQGKTAKINELFLFSGEINELFLFSGEICVLHIESGDFLISRNDLVVVLAGNLKDCT